MRIKVVIMCHNTASNSDLLYNQLSKAFDVSLFDSGSEVRPKNTTHKFGNIYWTGLWDEAIKRYKDYDVIWGVGGDITLKDDPYSYREAIETAMPFGCWSPAIEGTSRDFMNVKETKNEAWQVWHVEGMSMAVSIAAIDSFYPFPQGNILGWGVDVFMCCKSWQRGLHNVLDGRVKVFHPKSRGYNNREAFLEMEQWLGGIFGDNWRDITRHWYEDFKTNTIDSLMKKRQVNLGVIISTYNNLQTLKLSLASFVGQSKLPKEVIIADDGSTDGTLEWLDAASGIYPFSFGYVTREHNGYQLVSINNLAVKQIKSSRILFTNADIIHCPESVREHSKLSKGVIGGGLFTGIAEDGVKEVTLDKVVDFDQIRKLKEKYPPKITNEEYLIRNPEDNIWGCWGGNYSIEKSDFLQVKGFNEEYNGKWGGEEADFLFRAKKIGCYLSWVPGSEAFHLEHPIRAYKKRQLGNQKCKQENL